MQSDNQHRTKGVSQTKAGWRVNEWARDTGLGRSSVYGLLGEGQIASVKVGKSRIITTAPAEFLAARGPPHETRRPRARAAAETRTAPPARQRRSPKHT